jgi:phospholipid transport system transporter-binding protein
MTETKIDRQGDSDFRISGDMTFETTRKLLNESKALFQDIEDIKLDLAQVEHVDSAGLALLLEWITQAKQKGGKISLKDMPESLLAIARLCQVDSTLDSLVEKKSQR